jgi:hypothetical protein
MCSEETWFKVKAEYVTTNISLRTIAEKYDIPYPTVRDRSRREFWANEKGKAKSSITEKIVSKVISATSQKIADTLQKELRAAELIQDRILSILEDPKQFNRHLVQMKEKSGDMHSGINEEQWVEEKIFDKADTKALKDLADALNKSTELKKKILGLVDPVDREKLDMEREKLQLDKTKAGLGDEDEEEKQTGIVYLPAVDHEAYEKEKETELARIQAEVDSRKVSEMDIFITNLPADKAAELRKIIANGKGGS